MPKPCVCSWHVFSGLCATDASVLTDASIALLFGAGSVTASELPSPLDAARPHAGHQQAQCIAFRRTLWTCFERNKRRAAGFAGFITHRAGPTERFVPAAICRRAAAHVRVARHNSCWGTGRRLAAQALVLGPARPRTCRHQQTGGPGVAAGGAAPACAHWDRCRRSVWPRCVLQPAFSAIHILAERSPGWRFLTAAAAVAAADNDAGRDPASANAPAGRSSSKAATPADPAPCVQRRSSCDGALALIFFTTRTVPRTCHCGYIEAVALCCHLESYKNALLALLC
jgi:hypothetical protein